VEGIKIPIGAPLGQLDSDLKGAQSKLKAFATSAASTAGTLGGSVAKGANQAGFALQNLGRVAQDAPFGFIGIQNNIQPLLESFQRLKAESGSTGGALKALGASLVGGGGLLLAVSLVTSALTVLAQNPEKVAGALNYLSGAVDDATATQKAYNAALIENVADANVEITTIQSLIKVAQDENLSRSARLEALKKVKAEYPEQLEFLNLENINSIKAAKAIDILTNSLIRKAKIQAAEKLIGEAFVKQLEATTKSAVEQASTFSKIVGASLGAVGIKNLVVLQDGLDNQKKAFKEAGEEVTTYTNLLQKLLADDATAGTLFDDSRGGKGGSGGGKDKVFAREKAITIERLNSLDTFLAKYRATEAEINKTPLISFPSDINKRLAAPFDNLKLNILPQLQSSFQTFFDDILMRGKLSFESLGKSILNTFASVLSNQATTGVLALLGDKEAQKKGNIFSSAGKLLGIGGGGGEGVASKGIGKLLGSIIPVAGIALAGASILGSIFKKKQPAPLPMQTQSVSTSSFSSSQSFSGSELIARVQGSDLLLVINRAQAKNRRFGP